MDPLSEMLALLKPRGYNCGLRCGSIVGAPTIGVNQHNPDFIKLAEAYGCNTAQPASFAELEAAVAGAFAGDRPTVIRLREDAGCLKQS